MVSIVRGVSGIVRNVTTDPGVETSDYENARKRLEEDLVGIRSTIKILSSNNYDVGLNSDEIRALNEISNKFYTRAKLSSEEAKSLLAMRDKVGELADVYSKAESQKTVSISSLLETYQSIINDNRLSSSVKRSAMEELNGILRVSTNVGETVNPLSLKRNNRIIEAAKRQVSDSNKQIRYADTVRVANITHRTREERESTDRFNIRDTGKTLRDSFLKSPSSISIGSLRKDAIGRGLGALGLGDLDNVLNLSGRLDTAISSMFRGKTKEESDSDEELKAISKEILKGESSAKPTTESTVTPPDVKVTPSGEPVDVGEPPEQAKLDRVNENLANLIKTTESGLTEISNKQSQIISGQTNLVDLDEKLISTVRANGDINHEEINPNGSDDNKSLADSLFDDALDYGRGRRGRRGRVGRGGRLGRLGRLGRIVDSAGLGGLAKTAGRASGALLKGAKFIPGVGMVITAGMAGMDAFSGWNGDSATSLFGKDTTATRLGSSAASVASGLTLGLASPQDIVNTAQSAIGLIQKGYDGAVSVAGGLANSAVGMYKSANDWVNGKISDASKWLTDTYDSSAKEISKGFDEASNLVSEFIDNPLKSIGKGFSGLFDWLCDLPVVGRFFKSLRNGANSLPSLMSGAGTYISTTATNIGNSVRSGYDSAVDTAGNVLQEAMQNTARFLPTSKEQASRRDSLAEYAGSQGISGKELGLFMGQVQHESGNFRYNQEIASGNAYEGRKDLGNTDPGDGKRYKGRGWIQLTGKSNYKKYGDELGIDLVAHPELAEDPEVANKLAVAYWKDRVRPAMDKGGQSVEVATKAVNGGYNGLSDRAAYTAEWLKSHPDVQSADSSQGNTASVVPLSDNKTVSIEDDVKSRRAYQQSLLSATSARAEAPPQTQANTPVVVQSDKRDTIDDYGLAFFNKMVFS